jgi:hypothetical protein
VDNSAFVAMAAAIALDDAVEAASILGHHVPEEWRAVRWSGLVVPQREDGVILDHDGYDPGEDKGATPAALCGLFPVRYPAPRHVVAGPFTANLGAFLTGCLYGLTGLRPTACDPEDW